MNYSVKLLAAVMVIFGGGYAGVLLSSAFSTRVRQLKQLSNGISQIGFNINFLHMNVADSMRCASGLVKGTVNKIFMCAAEDISSNGIKPSVAFDRAMRRYGDDLCLTSADREIIKEFADNLGIGDAESEMNNIKAAAAKLHLAETEAESERDQKGRLWRGVGILGGVFAVILLF